ncbi:MAG: phosphoribosylglycinamide formyltransferase [Candidatus Omnitrophica bacterium]|nr:phosphoribosylglycinamide formyltransferase [Candidatus Omnitrophota bacterium]
MPAVAVLCSGSGTNLQAIINAARRGRLRARVAVVVSDQPKAFALTRAARAGIPAIVVRRGDFPSRDAFDRRLLEILTPYRVRLVCLAGFMRVLSPIMVHRYPRRILNIHPALLPAFPGAHAVRDALAWGAKVTGVTVHVVDEEVDHGPIVLQEAVAIRPGEKEAALLKRVHRVEHRLYPHAITLMLSGRARVQGRRVSVKRAS